MEGFTPTTTVHGGSHRASIADHHADRPFAKLEYSCRRNALGADAGGGLGGGEAAVEGLDGQPGAAGKDVVEVQRALCVGRVPDLDLEMVVGAWQYLCEVLGWDEERIAHEVALYHGRVDAERRSQEQPSDEAADSVRCSVPGPYAAFSSSISH
jgi:hypothetical protein